MKKLKAVNTLYNNKIAEEKRVAQERAKVVSNREKAEKAAVAAAKKADLNTRKSLPTAQTGKRKASRAFSSKDKRPKRTGGGAAVAEVVPAPPPRLARSGRAVKLPTRYT
jgi:hypothetical protein